MVADITRIDCPLRVCIGASNALPTDESLAAAARRARGVGRPAHGRVRRRRIALGAKRHRQGRAVAPRLGRSSSQRRGLRRRGVGGLAGRRGAALRAAAKSRTDDGRRGAALAGELRARGNRGDGRLDRRVYALRGRAPGRFSTGHAPRAGVGADRGRRLRRGAYPRRGEVARWPASGGFG